MKKTPKVFYFPIEGSASLAACWFQGPYGDAIESKEGNGVYFTSPNGELLGVQFDDVNAEKDQQVMTTKFGSRIRVKVKSGEVAVKIENTTVLVKT